MISIRGTVAGGQIRPERPIDDFDGGEVIITFLEQPRAPNNEPEVNEAIKAFLNDPSLVPDPNYDPDKDPLIQTILDHQIDSGIGDLAHQHDHYLYGTPKRP